MLRLAPAGAWFLALVVTACGAPQAPDPVKVVESPTPLKQERPAPRDPDSPFRNPDKEPPLPRSEPQLPPDQLAAALAAADAALAVGDEVQASLALRSCANKVPQSVRCEGELALLLAKSTRRKYETRYYLEQAIAGDDPTLDPAFYRRLGGALRDRGMYPEAVAAFQRMLDRSRPPTGADYNLLAETLQSYPGHLVEAAEAQRKAYELEPTQLEWLRSEAILLGQVPDKFAQSIERFEEYRKKVKDPARIAEVDQRIGELKLQIESRDLEAAAAKSGKAGGKTAAKSAGKSAEDPRGKAGDGPRPSG